MVWDRALDLLSQALMKAGGGGEGGREGLRGEGEGNQVPKHAQDVGGN